MRGRAVAMMAAMIGLSCQRGETPEQAQARLEEETAAFRSAVEAAQSKYEAWEAAGQADSIVTLYTENAVVAFSNQAPLTGRQAIREAGAAIFALGTASVDIRAASAWANGDLGVDRGTYVYNFTPGPTAPAGMAAMFPDSGSYMAHWHRVNGEWMIADLVTSSMKPLPGMEPAAASQPAR